MARRKITGFARFIIALLVIIPISFGVSYLVTGESINVKELVQNFNFNTNKENIDNPTDDLPTLDTDNVTFNALDSINTLQDSIKSLTVRLDAAREDVKELKDRLDERDKLRNQIDSLAKIIDKQTTE